MVDIFLTIDGEEARIREGANLVAAARAAGIWVPTLCHLADLPPAPSDHACGVCLVEIEGEPEPVRACEAFARPGQVVTTSGEKLGELRRAALGRVLEDHPHACLTCAQREGCARETCPTNVAVAERCCPQLGDCELVRLVGAVGLPADLRRYVPAGVPVEEDPLFLRDMNLCIRCGRCVRACEHLRGVGALEITETDGAVAVVPRGGSVAASGCRHCGTCVEVCPTGARRDTGCPTGATAESVLACRNACPAGVDVPTYVALMAEGRIAEAAAVVRNHVPLPSILGHVCHRPCEDDCRRGRLSDPVAICDLERVAGEASSFLPEPRPDTGLSVAVIGGGPAGLSAAFYLCQLGHAPTVYEAESEPGGLLRSGIPADRLPREAVARDLALLEERGVAFATGLRVGGSLPFADLAGKFDAVVLATGAGPPRSLDVPGAGLRGIASALDFLRSAATGEFAPEVADRRVAVIGGGGMAMDAAAVAARRGAEQVDVFCLERAGKLPAHRSEIEAAEALGVRLHPGWGVSGFVAAGGRVGGVDLVKCTRVLDRRGRFAPEYDPGTSGRVPAEVVLVAAGQESTDPWPVARDANVPVVRAGALDTGSSNAARAIASGRAAAIAIHHALGFPGEPPAYAPAIAPSGRLVPVEDFAPLARTPLPLDADTAAAEADRCLRCGLRFDVNPPVSPNRPELRLV